MRPIVIVSVHDVAPGTAAATERWLDLLDSRGVPASLLVVPGPWRGHALRDDPTLVSALHDAADRGYEISLHGYTHSADNRSAGIGIPRALSGRVLARGCAEFAAIDRGEASKRIAAGLDELRSLGFTVTGFTPPGWLQSPGALEALSATDLRYTTTQWHVRELTSWRRLRIPALSHRPDSPWSATAAQALVQVGKRRLDRGRAIRLALHPRDLEDDRLLRATICLVDHALHLGARFTTYERLVQRWFVPGADRVVA